MTVLEGLTVLEMVTALEGDCPREGDRTKHGDYRLNISGKLFQFVQSIDNKSLF